MFLGVITVLGGLYVLLIALRIVHRDFLKPGGEDGPRRMGMTLFGAGMLIVGSYAVYHSFTLHANRNNPTYQAPGRSGVPGGLGRPGPGGSAPLFPPRSPSQNPR